MLLVANLSNEAQYYNTVQQKKKSCLSDFFSSKSFADENPYGVLEERYKNTCCNYGKQYILSSQKNFVRVF